MSAAVAQRLGPAFHRIVGGLHRRFEEVADELAAAIGDAEGAWPHSHHVRLRQLQAEAEHALKYGEHVHVELKVGDNGLRIIVEDAGPGLPEEELEKVFEPFYRVESSRNRETGGVGLGLAIVRQVARNHGCNVTLANRPGGGLRAVLWLPQLSQ